MPSDGYYTTKPKPVVLHPVQEKSGCVFGLKNEANEWVVIPKYKNIESLQPNSPGTCWSVSYEGFLYGMLDSAGREIFPPKYYGLSQLHGARNQYFAFMAENKRWGVITREGEVLIPAAYEEEISYDIWHKLFTVRSEDSVGVVNRSGKIIVPMTDGFVSPFIDGRALVSNSYFETVRYTRRQKKPLEQIRAGIVDTSGAFPVPQVYKEIIFSTADVVAAFDGTSWGVLSLENDTVLSFVFEKIRQPKRDSFLVVIDKGKQGVLNSYGNWVIRPEFDSVMYASAQYFFPALRNGYWTVLSRQGKRVVNEQIERLENFHYGHDWNAGDNLIAVAKGRYGVLSDSGTWLVRPLHELAGWVQKPRAYSAPDTLWLYDPPTASRAGGMRFYKLSPESKYVKTNDSPPKWTSVRSTKQEWIPADKILRKKYNVFNSFAGCIVTDSAGRQIMSPQPWNLRPVSPGIYAISNDSGTGIMDSAEHVIIKPVHRYAGRLRQFSIEKKPPYFNPDSDPNYYVIGSNGSIGAYDASGRLLVDTVYSSLHSGQLSSGRMMWIGVRRTDYSKDWIDSTGRVLGSYDGIIDVNRKSMLVRSGKQEFLVSIHTKKKIPGTRYKWISANGEGFYKYGFTWGRSGLMKADGEKILLPVYTRIEYIHPNLWLVKRKNKTGLCDSTGRWRLPLSENGLLNKDSALQHFLADETYYSEINYPSHRGDTVFVSGNYNMRTYFNGSYELFRGPADSAFERKANNIICDKIISAYLKKDRSRGKEIVIKPAMSPYENGKVGSNDFTDYRILSHTKNSFALAKVTSTWLHGKLYRQSFEVENFYFIEGRFDELRANELFLRSKEPQLAALVLSELSKKTDDTFVYECGSPGRLIYDAYYVSDKGITFVFTNKSQNLPYWQLWIASEIMEKIFLPWDKLKEMIDPEGPMAIFLEN